MEGGGFAGEEDEETGVEAAVGVGSNWGVEVDAEEGVGVEGMEGGEDRVEEVMGRGMGEG